MRSKYVVSDKLCPFLFAGSGFDVLLLYWQLFDFARNHQGLYQSSIPSAGGFYASNGFQDELVWAAAWLYHATDDKSYLDFVQSSGNSGGTRTQFSWDDKYIGAQVLIAKVIYLCQPNKISKF